MAYYNDNDEFVVRWLRNLAERGMIPGGTFDARDIRWVSSDKAEAQSHFFAGIGGWAYALRLAGWPDERPVWTGSCPCQPFSQAGKGRGTADERHLWPAWLRLIAERRPPTIFGEQVASPLGREWLAGVRADLEVLGYAVGCADLCAASTGQKATLISDNDICVTCGRYWDSCECILPGPFTGQEDIIVGPPHIRQRLFWVGKSDSEGWYPREQTATAVGHGSTPVTASSPRGLADPRCKREDTIRGVPEGQGAERARGIHRMGDTNGGKRSQRQKSSTWQERPTTSGAGAPLQSPWTQYALVSCADGKQRRVEPGTFPLAHGVPCRVGKLHAYGNAICPQVAAEFVAAYLQTETEA